MTRHVELLAPAGSLKTMRYAFAYGADAVYAGAARYSLRMRGNEFNDENLKIAIDEAHGQGKLFFLTVNAMPHNYKLQTAVRDLTPTLQAGPDACIMSDPGLIMLVKDAFPAMPIHLSVQANSMNWASVKFWQRNGVSRIILSRELSLDEIAEIRQQCPDIELEVFVHGALCIAYSGRCLLSGYFNNRDPNQGVCNNACRWKYKTHGAEENAGDFIPTPDRIFAPDSLQGLTAAGLTDPKDRHPLADQTYFLEDVQRPGEYMEITEDDHGTYIMNSRDLRAIEHVGELVKIGVDCLKLEGRTKSHYYTARTSQLYRRAIDDALAGRPFNPELSVELEGLANRGYTDGFFVRRQIKAQQNYATGSSNSATQQFVGEVLDYDPASGLATVAVKNQFKRGDSLEVIDPRGNWLTRVADLRDATSDEPLEVAKGSGWVVKVAVGEVGPLSLLARNLPGAG